MGKDSGWLQFGNPGPGPDGEFMSGVRGMRFGV